ncbi:hypothetical protein PORY_000753 [Pneumocystis oryctolagi]|uniref:Uncharacterized protein n=1 Tax=Pneumocystis oryctolagi TaxID=42067 RepID=A0ACB7CFV3_9ASCO|nr:hypothetical protein PORY_000753 [Pneumocystis oryctolagi]
MSAGFYKGISSEQDTRFTNAEKKLLKNTKFPDEFSVKVDMDKVNLSVMKPWITQKVIDLLGFEDDVVINFAFQMIESTRFPDPKRIQINLTGFLEKKASLFTKELWALLQSAQQSIGGIPAKFVEEKKAELQIKKLEEKRLSEELRKQKENDRKNDEKINAIRERERKSRRSSYSRNESRSRSRNMYNERRSQKNDRSRSRNRRAYDDRRRSRRTSRSSSRDRHLYNDRYYKEDRSCSRNRNSYDKRHRKNREFSQDRDSVDRKESSYRRERSRSWDRHSHSRKYQRDRSSHNSSRVRYKHKSHDNDSSKTPISKSNEDSCYGSTSSSEGSHQKYTSSEIRSPKRSSS